MGDRRKTNTEEEERKKGEHGRAYWVAFESGKCE